MKTIIFLNQYYSPLANPPAKRLSGFAEYFAKNKWNVKVITGQPNYPTGKLLKGYNWFWKKEKINGVKVYRFFEIPLKNEGFIKRIINYLSFTFSSIFSLPLIINSDVVFISSPPLFSAIIPYWYARLFKKKIIFDVRDLWPESTVEVVNVKKGFFYKILLAIVKKIYKKADLIICVSEEMKKQIKKYEDREIWVSHNFANKKKYEQAKNKKIKIVYTGILTQIQDFQKILPLNENLKIREKYEWHIIGSGDEYNTLKANYAFENITFYGQQSKEFCNDMIRKADLCILPLIETKLFKMALPSKIMEYTAYGKPVVTNWSTQLKTFIKKYDAGYHLDSIKELKKLLLEIEKEDLLKKTKGAQKLFDENFDKKKVCQALYERVKKL